jgi:hypothetical protein
MHEEPPKKEVLRIDLTGYKHANWRVKFRAAIIRTLRSAAEKLSGATINPETKETVGEEASKLTAKSLQALESQLDKQPIENQLKQAQIEKTYEEKEKIRADRKKTEAEIRKLNADARGQELANLEKFLDFADHFEKRTGKKLLFRIEGELGKEIIFLPAHVAKYLSERVEDKEKASEHDKLSG